MLTNDTTTTSTSQIYRLTNDVDDDDVYRGTLPECRRVSAEWTDVPSDEITLLADGKPHIVGCVSLTITPVAGRLYQLAEDCQPYDTVEASTVEDALEIARHQFDPASYDSAYGTVYIEISASEIECGGGIPDSLDEMLVVSPPEPKCTEPEHIWEAPHDVVGGLIENPGVVGNGGGVVITEVCSSCGVYRVTDTWAQSPTTGQQGLTSVAYRSADDATLAYVAGLAITA